MYIYNIHILYWSATTGVWPTLGTRIYLPYMDDESDRIVTNLASPIVLWKQSTWPLLKRKSEKSIPRYCGGKSSIDSISRHPQLPLTLVRKIKSGRQNFINRNRIANIDHQLSTLSIPLARWTIRPVIISWPHQAVPLLSWWVEITSAMLPQMCWPLIRIKNMTIHHPLALHSPWSPL